MDGLKESISIAGSSNGRTVDFDSINLGSNPSPAALLRLSDGGSSAPPALYKKEEDPEALAKGRL